MRPLKARGKEWVHGLNSGGGGGGGSTVTAGSVSRLGRPRGSVQSSGGLDEEVDSDGSDLVRSVFVERLECRCGCFVEGGVGK